MVLHKRTLTTGITTLSSEYFLEAELVTELLAMIASKPGSRETKAECVCHYATWDAYPDWVSDLEYA